MTDEHSDIQARLAQAGDRLSALPDPQMDEDDRDAREGWLAMLRAHQAILGHALFAQVPDEQRERHARQADAFLHEVDTFLTKWA
jgi:hypothetical protein